MTNGKPIKIFSRETFNSALSLNFGKLRKKTNKPSNPSKLANTNTEEGDDEVESYIQRVKLAVIKSAIFAGNAVFAELLGIGGMTLVIPEIGDLIMANPKAVLIGSTIVFLAQFFLKLKMVLNINGQE